MKRDKIIIAGLAAALCLIGLIDMGYGNGSICKIVHDMFFMCVGLIVAIPVMIIGALLLFCLASLSIIATNILGFMSLLLLALWYKNRRK